LLRFLTEALLACGALLALRRCPALVHRAIVLHDLLLNLVHLPILLLQRLELLLLASEFLVLDIQPLLLPGEALSFRKPLLRLHFGLQPLFALAQLLLLDHFFLFSSLLPVLPSTFQLLPHTIGATGRLRWRGVFDVIEKRSLR
jgi:hypothetical protein